MKAPHYKVVLTGGTALEVVAKYFRDAGCEVPPADEPLDVSAPDFIYDITSHDEVLSSEVPGFFDAKMEKLSGCRYSVDGIKAIVEEFFWYAESVRSGAAIKKVLAVDADNTLWRGILSEDGREKLLAYRQFQQGLLELRRDGVLLLALSKNDPVFPFIREDMELKDSDFSAMKIAWSPKSGNLLEAVSSLSLAPDSVVFVDDNPYERAEMSAHLPEVAIAPFNGFPVDSVLAEKQILRRLREYFFSGCGLTEEDRLRAADYSKRAAAEIGSYATREDFLKSLGLWVVPGRMKECDLDRLAQMAAKINQFNATTIRRSREEFEAMLNDRSKAVYTFRAGDRFGEQGLVCYIIVDLEKRRITDFAMSCRAMGRGLENFALSYVTAEIGGEVEIDFVATAKNRPFADFLKSGRFSPENFYLRVF